MSDLPKVTIHEPAAEVRRKNYGVCFRCSAKLHPRELSQGTPSGVSFELKFVCENGHHADDVWNDHPYPEWTTSPDPPLARDEDGPFRMAAS